MKLLVFADLHTPCIDKIKSIDFKKYNCAACITLGDIDTDTLKAIINNVDCDIYSILGNHDNIGTLAELNVFNIDKKKIEICGFSIVGLSGSSRYKEGNYPMLSQLESIEVSKRLPSADILVTHDSAYGLYGVKSDTAHCGLKGITLYVKKYKPFLNIHGHHHENTVKIYKKTIDICVFGCSVIEVSKESVKDVARVF